MRLVVSLLAAAVIGADGPGARDTAPAEPTAGAPAGAIGYQVKFLVLDGLGWRASLHAQLRPVTRQGAVTVWTASRETASTLADTASSRKSCQVVAAPRVTADPGVRATVYRNTTRKVVADVTREADGPVDHASFVGFVPRLADATEGFSVAVMGRALDQGVLTQVALNDAWIPAVHSVRLTESLAPKDQKACCAGGEGCAPAPAAAAATIQVPEVVKSSVAGEWLIPRGDVLVVSLGTHTVADDSGKAVVHERLAVVEAEAEAAPQGGDAPTFALGTLQVIGDVRKIPVATPAELPLPKPVPSVPSRSLPQAFDASGDPLPLPPLPDDDVSLTSTTPPGTSDIRATPQARVPVEPGEPIPWKKSELRDLGVHHAGHDVDSPCCDAGVGLPPALPGAASTFSPSDGGKTLRFGNIEVEIRTRNSPPRPTPGMFAPSPD